MQCSTVAVLTQFEVNGGRFGHDVWATLLHGPHSTLCPLYCAGTLNPRDKSNVKNKQPGRFLHVMIIFKACVSRSAEKQKQHGIQVWFKHDISPSISYWFSHFHSWESFISRWESAHVILFKYVIESPWSTEVKNKQRQERNHQWQVKVRCWEWNGVQIRALESQQLQ